MQAKTLFYTLTILLVLMVVTISESCSKTNFDERIFYVNNILGSDSNDGATPESAWKTLEHASIRNYSAGDKLLLCNGCTFLSKLELSGGGSQNDPVIVSNYDPGNGETALPIIDAKGYIAAIQISNSRNFEISNLELTSNAGSPKEGDALKKRFGVLVTANLPGNYSNILLKKLNIHHIYSTKSVSSGGQNPTSNMGMGISINMQNKNARI